MIDTFSIFKDFKIVATEDLTLLGASTLEGKAVDNALKDKIVTLERSINRLSILQSHDARCLFKNLNSDSKAATYIYIYIYIYNISCGPLRVPAILYCNRSTWR